MQKLFENFHIFYIQKVPVWLSRPPWYIFGRQVLHSGGHLTVPAARAAVIFYFSNPALPPVVALTIIITIKLKKQFEKMETREY